MPLTILIRRRQVRVLGELDDRAGSPEAVVRRREDERVDVACQQGADAHRAGLLRGEDRGIGEPGRTELAGRLAQGDDDGMGRRIVRLPDAVVGADDHRVVDDGHRGDRSLATGQGQLGFLQRLAHEQLVIHVAMLADGHQPLPNRNRSAGLRRRSMSRAMTTSLRIGILTGGGDVPGLNAVIKSVVYRATEAGHDVLGHPPRVGGPHPRPDRPRARRRRISGRSTGSTPGPSSGPAGTVLHTSRTNPRKMRTAGLPPWMDQATASRYAVGEDLFDLTPLVLDNLSALGIDLLVTIGGDDTLSYSQVLVNSGVPLVAIPKTMDNDVQGTEYCIGFSTAITRAKEAINRQRTTLGSHERIGVFRIFGRDAGFSALYTAYVTSARCVIPEMPYDLDALSALLAADHEANPSHYAFVITAEGAIWQGAQMADVGTADAFGHRHKANVGEALAAELRDRTGIETLASELTYDLRSGEPDSIDSMVATTFANVAMDLIESGVTGRMVAIQDGKYAHTALPDPALGPRKVDVPVMYNVARFRPRYDGKLGDPMLLVGLD